MPTKLTTTISKIASLSNSTNAVLINEFHQYMKSNGASEQHQNNNLKAVIAFANFLGTDMTFFDVQLKEQILVRAIRKQRIEASSSHQKRVWK